MKDLITIGKRKIGINEPTFVIGELSCNHRQDYDLAVKTVHAMNEAGVDCVKLQTAKPESLTIDSDKEDFIIKGGTLWDNRKLFDLYQDVYTPWEWHERLQKLVKAWVWNFSPPLLISKQLIFLQI